MNKLRLIAAAVGFGLFAACIGLPAAAQVPKEKGKEEVEAVVAAWKARRAALKSVRYELTGTQTITPALMNHADRPSRETQDIQRSDGGVVLIDFEKSRVRIERQTSFPSGTGPPVVSRNRTDVLDEKGYLKSFFHRTEDEIEGAPSEGTAPDITVYKASNGFLTPEIRPILWAHGLVSYPLTSFPTNKLRQAPQPDLLISQGRVVENTTVYQVVKSEAPGGKKNEGVYDEYRVDPARQSAVVKATEFVAGQPRHQYEVQYTLTNGTWLPTGWTCSLSLGGELMRSYQYTMQVFTDPVVEDSDFDIPVRPGMVVTNSDGLNRADVNGTLHPWDGKATGLSWETRLWLKVAAGFLAVSTVLIYSFMRFRRPVSRLAS